MAGDFCPPTKGVVVFETIEQAQRAANTFTGDEHFPKVKMHIMNFVNGVFVDCNVLW